MLLLGARSGSEVVCSNRKGFDRRLASGNKCLRCYDGSEAGPTTRFGRVEDGRGGCAPRRPLRFQLPGQGWKSGWRACVRTLSRGCIGRCRCNASDKTARMDVSEPE